MTRAIGNTYAQETAIVASVTYLGGESIEPDGSSAAATLPDGTTTVIISAEGGAAYYELNGTDADASSPGYVPEDGFRAVLGVSNLETLFVYAAASVIVHLEYYQD